jgi:hypothetical protein
VDFDSALDRLPAILDRILVRERVQTATQASSIVEFHRSTTSRNAACAWCSVDFTVPVETPRTSAMSAKGRSA